MRDFWAIKAAVGRPPKGIEGRFTNRSLAVAHANKFSDNVEIEEIKYDRW